MFLPVGQCTVLPVVESVAPSFSLLRAISLPLCCPAPRMLSHTDFLILTHDLIILPEFPKNVISFNIYLFYWDMS